MVNHELLLLSRLSTQKVLVLFQDTAPILSRNIGQLSGVVMRETGLKMLVMQDLKQDKSQDLVPSSYGMVRDIISRMDTSVS